MCRKSGPLTAASIENQLSHTRSFSHLRVCVCVDLTLPNEGAQCPENKQ